MRYAPGRAAAVKRTAESVSAPDADVMDKSTLGNSLAPIFVADFPPYAHKFIQRTRRVRLVNLCTSDEKSSHKSEHKEFPRVLKNCKGGEGK